MAKYWIGQDPNAEATTAKCAALAALTAIETALLDGAGIGGTPNASKVVVADANQNIGAVKATSVAIGTSGSEITIGATPAEIDRVADKSASIVNAAGDTLTITALLHGNRTVVMGKTTGTIITLPAATGTGIKYTFIIGVAATSNANIIKVANATDVFNGSTAYGVDDDAEGATGYQWMAEVADDTLTMNGTATGGLAGNMIEVLDYKAGFFRVTAFLIQSGGAEATPFSATVA